MKNSVAGIACYIENVVLRGTSDQIKQIINRNKPPNLEADVKMNNV